MPYEVSWLIEDQVVYIRNWGAGTEAEMRGAIRDVGELINSSPRASVHVLNDSSGVTETIDLGTILKVIRSTSNPAKTGWMLTVQIPHPVMRFLMDAASQIAKARYRNFKTVGEAMAYLKLADDTIDWNKLPEKFTT